jgi:polyisoprenoid-binding protein YceI
MKNLITIAFVFLALALVPLGAHAEDYSFDVETKFVNISFESKMDVEDILGTTHSVEGHARFDGGSGAFEVKVPVATLRTGIDVRDEHLRSAHWLDAEKHPHIIFKGDSIVDKGKGEYDLTGKLVVHGVEKALTIPVSVKKIDAAKSGKFGLGDKGAARVRAEFKIKLSDHGVVIPEMAAAKVSDVWTVKISVFAKGK